MERHMTQAAQKADASGGRRGAGKAVRRAAAGRFSITSLMDERGSVKVDEVAETLSMSKAQLAETAGLARTVFQKASRATDEV
jgi:hypothetical protein